MAWAAEASTNAIMPKRMSVWGGQLARKRLEDWRECFCGNQMKSTATPYLPLPSIKPRHMNDGFFANPRRKGKEKGRPQIRYNPHFLS
jgi:hypothetical protein